MAVISRLTTWAIGNTLTAAALNAEFDNILNDYNGNITNANISASAAISYSKLALTGSIVNGDISGSAAIAYSKLNLTGNIVNADISALAAIAQSKLSLTTSGSGSTLLLQQKPTVNGSIGAYTSNSDGATITFDMAASNTHTVTLGGNRTLAVSNVSVGQKFAIRLVQDGTGNRVVTWFSGIKWSGGAAPTLSTGAAKIDWVGFICTATNQYDGFVLGLGLA